MPTFKNTNNPIMAAADAPLQFSESDHGWCSGVTGCLLCPKCGWDCTHVDTAIVTTESGHRVSATATGGDEHSRLYVEVLSDVESLPATP